MSDAIAEVRIAPDQLPLQVLCIGLDEQLVRVEAIAFLGRVRPMHAIAVQQARTRLRQIRVPDLIGTLAQLDPLQLVLAAGIEQTQLHFVGAAGKNGEIDTFTVPRGATGIRLAGPDRGDGKIFGRR